MCPARAKLMRALLLGAIIGAASASGNTATAAAAAGPTAAGRGGVHVLGTRERRFMASVPRALRSRLATGAGTKRTTRGKVLLASGLTSGLGNRGVLFRANQNLGVETVFRPRKSTRARSFY